MNTAALVIIERPFSDCAVVTLNRPEAKNALSRALRCTLARVFYDLQQDAQTRVVVLTGAGSAFCAGLDLKELASNPDTALTPSPEEDPLAAIGAFAHPIIGAINGPAITGGFELALACDMLVASSAARFADTHARVGVLPGWGLSQILPRLIGVARAKELSFTGNFLSATRAEAWGLVNRVVEPAALMPQALALAKDILTADPETVRAYKRIIDDGIALNLGDALQLEKARSREWATNIDALSIEQRRLHLGERSRVQYSDKHDS